VASVEFGRGVALRWPASPSHRHWNRGVPSGSPSATARSSAGWPRYPAC